MTDQVSRTSYDTRSRLTKSVETGKLVISEEVRLVISEETRVVTPLVPLLPGEIRGVTVEVDEIPLTRQRGSVVREVWCSIVVWSSPKRSQCRGVGSQSGHLRRVQCCDVS